MSLPAEPGEPFRVVVFTGGPALQQDARRFVERLQAHAEIEVAGVFCESAGQGMGEIWRDLWRRRRLLAVPLLVPQLARSVRRRHGGRRGRSPDGARFVRDMHADEILETVRALAPELGLIYGGPILRRSLFEIPTPGPLGIHHGKLPEYRGKKTTFWAIFHGERTAGVAIQRVGTKLDGGDVVKQGEVAIGRRSLAAVKNELETLGYELYLQAILEVKRGTASFQPQGRSGRRPYRDPLPADLLVFCWRQLKRRLRGS